MTTDEITTLPTVLTMDKGPMAALALALLAAKLVIVALVLPGTANPAPLSRMCAVKYSAAVAVQIVDLLAPHALLPAIAVDQVVVDVDLVEVNN
jgi:hypothetical protein